MTSAPFFRVAGRPITHSEGTPCAPACQYCWLDCSSLASTVAASRMCQAGGRGLGGWVCGLGRRAGGCVGRRGGPDPVGDPASRRPGGPAGRASAILVRIARAKRTRARKRKVRKSAIVMSFFINRSESGQLPAWAAGCPARPGAVQLSGSVREQVGVCEKTRNPKNSESPVLFHRVNAMGIMPNLPAGPARPPGRRFRA